MGINLIQFVVMKMTMEQIDMFIAPNSVNNF